jgi:hypothetical protein
VCGGAVADIDCVVLPRWHTEHVYIRRGLSRTEAWRIAHLLLRRCVNSGGGGLRRLWWREMLSFLVKKREDAVFAACGVRLAGG